MKKPVLTALFVVLALGLVTTAAAKKPVRNDPPASATATYDPSSNTISVSGCGYDFQVVGVSYVAPDGSSPPGIAGWTLADGHTTTYLVGMWFNGCMDTNTFQVPTGGSGTWAVNVWQDPPGTTGGFDPSTAVLMASTTVAVP